MKMNFKKIKALILVILLTLSTLLSTGCFLFKYRGDHPELCSAAWANLITADGRWADGCELSGDPSILILEEDGEGRVLFSYFEGYRSLMNLMIIQGSDENNVYFYSDDCYISCVVSDEKFVGWRSVYPSDEDVREIIESDFSKEQIDELKAKNDWGKPIDNSKCESTAIVDIKPDTKIKLKDSHFENIVEEYYVYTERYVHPKNVSHVWTSSYITSDAYGRELHLVNTKITDYYDKYDITYEYPLLMVIMPDKSCDVSTIVIIEDSINPQELVKEIKTANGWNTPIE